MVSQKFKNIPIILEEAAGFDRRHEPVSFGIPFPKSALYKKDQLQLITQEGHPVPIQTEILAHWPEGSIKWLLLDFQAHLSAHTKTEYLLRQDLSKHPVYDKTFMEISENPKSILIHTQNALFKLSKKIFSPFESIVLDDKEMIRTEGCHFILIGSKGNLLCPRIDQIKVESQGPLRTTLLIEGSFAPKHKFIKFFSRIHFFLNHSLIRMEFTLHNSKAAKHWGGLWDLGDKNSFLFKKVALQTELETTTTPDILWAAQTHTPPVTSRKGQITIYQDSSGGENWNSRNHVNRFGKVPLTFQGYRVCEENHTILEGRRADPVISIQDKSKRISGTVQNFWQQFPKAMQAIDGMLEIDLFPDQFQDLHELQPGEQKTHSLFLNFQLNPSNSTTGLEWIQTPIIPRIAPSWYAESKVFPCLIPSTDKSQGRPAVSDHGFQTLIDCAIKGDSTFFDRREIIDEYGWRNFGEFYADHEDIYFKGVHPVISHYNNQYDGIYGSLTQYARSGDLRWFQLAQDLAKHVMDIDIYHTHQDLSAYNGGLFWHTEHYSDASTCTHRAFSRESLKKKPQRYCGGGPANAHNYTTGLLYYYYLTGDRNAKISVISLADWVIHMDDGTQSIWGIFNSYPTGKASSTASPDYHGPGRGCGNSVNALMDAYLITQDIQYITKAEELIRRSVHPRDKIEEFHLLNAEKRWSYTVFLEALAKYLNFKLEQEDFDDMFYYSRESLLHYAKWMMMNEVPYLSKKDELEYPTETWPAQDIRKACVLRYAAQYCNDPSLRPSLIKKSEEFFAASLHQLMSFDSRTLVRPLVVLMPRGGVLDYFKNDAGPHKVEEKYFHFREPEKFISQSDHFKRTLKTPLGLMKISLCFFRPKFLVYLFKKVFERLKI